MFLGILVVVVEVGCGGGGVGRQVMTEFREKFGVESKVWVSDVAVARARAVG